MALAGRYGYLLDAAARNPSRTIAASALGAGLLGGASSAIGNLVDKEQGEGPLRVVSEATNAGILSAVPGALTGFSAAVMGAMRKPGALRRAIKSSGSAANTRQALQRVANTGVLAAASLPVAAGLGGMMGGGESNLYNAMGIPGFQPGINPESYGSSNMQAI